MDNIFDNEWKKLTVGHVIFFLFFWENLRIALCKKIESVGFP